MLYELGCYIFFSERQLHSWCVSCMQRSAHIWVFSSAPFFVVVFFLLCLCMHDIHNMHDQALCFSVDTSVAKLVCITFMKHACIHACLHACMHHQHHACGQGIFGSDLCCDMAHFEQASLLATAWANTDGVKERALQHSIVQVSKNNKIKRSRIPSGCLVVGLTISV